MKYILSLLFIIFSHISSANAGVLCNSSDNYYDLCNKHRTKLNQILSSYTQYATERSIEGLIRHSHRVNNDAEYNMVIHHIRDKMVHGNPINKNAAYNRDLAISFMNGERLGNREFKWDIVRKLDNNNDGKIDFLDYLIFKGGASSISSNSPQKYQIQKANYLFEIRQNCPITYSLFYNKKKQNYKRYGYNINDKNTFTYRNNAENNNNFPKLTEEYLVRCLEGDPSPTIPKEFEEIELDENDEQWLDEVIQNDPNSLNKPDEYLQDTKKSFNNSKASNLQKINNAKIFEQVEISPGVWVTQEVASSNSSTPVSGAVFTKPLGRACLPRPGRMFRDPNSPCHCPPQEFCPKTIEEWSDAPRMPTSLAELCCDQPVQCNYIREKVVDHCNPVPETTYSEFDVNYCEGHRVKACRYYNSNTLEEVDQETCNDLKNDSDPNSNCDIMDIKGVNTDPNFSWCNQQSEQRKSDSCTYEKYPGGKVTTSCGQMVNYMDNCIRNCNVNTSIKGAKFGSETLIYDMACISKCLVTVKRNPGIGILECKTKKTIKLCETRKYKNNNQDCFNSPPCTKTLYPDGPKPNCQCKMFDENGQPLRRMFAMTYFKDRSICKRNFGTNNCWNCKHPPEFTCFSPETLIIMADGSEKRIDQVKSGDLVRGELAFNEVSKVKITSWDEVTMYKINGNRLTLTDNHPIRTKDGWKTIAKTKDSNLSTLEVGDMLVLHNDKFLEVTSISATEKLDEYQVYNLILNGTGSFYANGILVKGN